MGPSLWERFLVLAMPLVALYHAKASSGAAAEGTLWQPQVTLPASVRFHPGTGPPCRPQMTPWFWGVGSGKPHIEASHPTQEPHEGSTEEAVDPLWEVQVGWCINVWSEHSQAELSGAHISCLMERKVQEVLRTMASYFRIAFHWFPLPETW